MAVRESTPSTLSFDAGTIDEKTLARQLHKHDANDGAVLDDNNCAARFSAEELERLFAYEETASELYASQARGRKAWPAYVPSAISDGALKAAAAFGVTYVKSDTHAADGHQSSDDEASDSEAEEPSRKSGSTATRSYHTGRTPNDDDEEEFQFDEVSAPTKKRRVITEDPDDE